MSRHLINCINKPHHLSPHEHITFIGNDTGNWKISVAKAVTCLEAANGDRFYTLDKQTGRHIEIGVVRQQGKVPYVRTRADGKWNDNLLAQKECPATCRVID